MKNKNLIVRLDERDSIKLQELCKFYGLTKSDLIRVYISEDYFNIKYGLVNKREP